MSQPLILTLQIDEPAQVFYEGLRRHYFPPERNLIPAHLTLFHHLPDEDSTYEIVREAAEAHAGFLLTHPTVRSIGRGVAVFFQSEDLQAIHAALSASFEADLIPQDRQRIRPHIVVQNKVDPETARLTLPILQGTQLIAPRALGFTVWRYLGGPWERLLDLAFGSGSTRVG